MKFEGYQSIHTTVNNSSAIIMLILYLLIQLNKITRKLSNIGWVQYGKYINLDLFKSINELKKRFDEFRKYLGKKSGLIVQVKYATSFSSLSLGQTFSSLFPIDAELFID
ncbi:hypothetical protein, partial [Candidatus Cardinium sp. cBcalN1]|uniref:hypothetical protein n=1 Tax=Candidatus Cardinium sp. cBcalN1 TaxID=2699437 RepID=UPI001FB47322